MQNNIKKNFKIAAISFFVLAIVGYGLFQSRNLIAGPKITIFEPQDGSFLTHKATEIRGHTENTSKITLNGKDVLIDPEGDFREKILLSKGYNVFVLNLKDRFGRERNEKLELVF